MPTLRQQYPRISVSTEPTVEPVTVAEGLAFCQYEGTDAESQEHMRGLLLTARQTLERRGKLAFCTQSRQIKLDSFPCWEQELRVFPVSAMTSIVYRDTAGDSQTLSASLYQLDTATVPPFVRPAEGETWPQTQLNRVDAVTYTFVAGYGGANDVPEQIKTAIKFLARSMSRWAQCGDEEMAHSLIDDASWSAPV